MKYYLIFSCVRKPKEPFGLIVEGELAYLPVWHLFPTRLLY